MQYRQLGKTGLRVSALGFGCMRFPTLGGDRANIDEPEATRMLHYAIDQGVNYLDSGFGYHGGNSERLLGRALKGGYRRKVTLATKLPFREVHEASDLDRVLNEQLARLQTDHIDCYLLHGLRQVRWEGFKEFGITEWGDKVLADGRVGRLGFSFHDTLEAFKAIIDEYDGWRFCQIQYNYMNEHYQAGTEGLRYAALKGLGVVVMEPLLGGRLASPPAPVQAIWDRAPIKRSPAEWGLQWAWNQPEVSLVLSGMSSMAQVVENLQSADRSKVGALTEEELALVGEARAHYESLCAALCTGCKYCMPCPNGVDIPRNFVTLNNAVMYGQMEEARRRYARMEEGERAEACQQCRECEDECPQSIRISEWMPHIHQVLGEGAAYDPEACAGF